MAAAKGNNYSQGKGGRKKEVGRPCRDYADEAEKLIEWAKKEDSIILRAWCIDRLISQEELMSWCQKSELFRKAYKQAQTWIGVRREAIALKQGNGAPYSRYAAVYDKKLDDHERSIRAENKGNEQSTQVILIDKGSLDSKRKLEEIVVDSKEKVRKKIANSLPKSTKTPGGKTNKVEMTSSDDQT